MKLLNNFFSYLLLLDYKFISHLYLYNLKTIERTATIYNYAQIY